MKYISYLKIRETNEQRGEIKIKLYQKNTLIIKLGFVMNPSLIFDFYMIYTCDIIKNVVYKVIDKELTT